MYHSNINSVCTYGRLTENAMFIELATCKIQYKKVEKHGNAQFTRSTNLQTK